MAWISKGYIHTVYSDHVTECSRCGQLWVPERAFRNEHCKSFTCPGCTLTAAPVYLPRVSEKGYDEVVRECWEQFHSVTGRFLVHPDRIVECLACGHVWLLHKDGIRRMMCAHCHRTGVPQYTDEPAPRKPYGWTDFRPTPSGGGNHRVRDHEVLCTRCDRWVPFCAGARLVTCPGCEIPITIRLVGDKRLRRLNEWGNRRWCCGAPIATNTNGRRS